MAASGATGLSPVCYNHPEKKADFKCFDCKRDSIINLCPQCNIQVHSLDVFRAHRVELIEIKNRERRLSQDVNDIEKLIAVESDILQNVLTRLKYCEEEEKETISHLIQLQTATKKRIAEIKECEARIEKAFSYLTKVSTLLTQCSSPVEISDTSESLKNPFVPEATAAQPKGSVQVQDAPLPPCVHPAQEPAGEAQNGPPEEPPIKLPDEIKGKDIFPVSVVGSLARNGSFWMIKIGESDLDKQRQIQAGIRTHYQIHGYGSSIETNVGTLCATLNRHNKEFCRVRIASVANTGMVKIRFVDLGFVEDVPPSSLCELQKEFVDIPFQALECCLLPNLDTQLPYEAKWCFKDLTFNKVLMASLEGQVTDKKGCTVNHVMLASCSEVPVCINTKVAKLVEEQRVALEDRPVQPSKAEKVENDAVVGGEVKHETTTVQTDVPCDLASETVSKVDTESVPSEEKEEHTLVNRDDEINVTDVPVLSVPSDDNGVTQRTEDSSPILRADAAEFVPVSPENSSQESSKIPFHVSMEQNKVPGILHLPVMEDKTASAKPGEESCETLPIDTQLPVGCVDFAMYNHIVSQCSMNMILMEVLPKARFFMIKSNIKRIVEAMKCKLWCPFSESNKKQLNHIFSEQAIKGGSPVFLLFSGLRFFNFCGMAQMVSAIDSNVDCPTSIKPSQFAGKMGMVGCCEIKWIYAHDLFFGDVLTPECGFHRRFLANCGDGAEIPNKLGQLIVQGYDSCNYYRSILKLALESYQSHVIEQQESMHSTVEPLLSSQPEKPNDGLPVSQEEDWDQEIEESLKATKSSEPEPLDEPSVEKEEPSSCVVSEVQTNVDVPASDEVPSFPVTVHSYESSKDSDSVPVSSAQSDTTDVDVQQDAVLPQDNDVLETFKDQSLSSVGLSTEMSKSDTLEGESTPVLVPSSEELQSEGSTPDVVAEDDAVTTGNESDWESTSPPKARGKDTVFTFTEVDSTITEHVSDHNTPTDDWQIQRSDDNLQSGSILDACNTADSESVVHTSDVSPCQDWEDDNTDEQTPLEQTSQEDLSNINLKEIATELNMPQGDSSRVVTIRDNPECGGEPPDSHFDDNAVVSDDGSKVPDSDAESSCAQPASSDTNSQSCLQPAKADHGSSEDLIVEYDDFPVEIGKEHYIYAQETLTSTGTFWARVYRSNEEEKSFMDAMKQMGARIEAKNEPLENIFIYKHCAVKGMDKYWYRALVEKTSDKGKVGIRLLDLGEYWEVHQKELRVLHDEFYAAPPAQAFECSVCYENPTSKKEKSRISRLVKRHKKVRVIVKNYSEGTVGVQILS